MDFSSYTAGQERSVRHLDGPLLVSAGAGSGKTFTLTQRIAWALLPGSGTDGAPFLGSIDEALVITFTEKAAAEIKERIRSTLRAEGMLDEALKVDAAWISTIHGACSRILHEHALEVGLDPAFSVLGATKEEELRMLAIEGVLARAEEGESAYKDLFTLFNADAVRSSVEDLLKVAHTLPDGLDAVDLGPVGTPLAEQARELLALAQEPPECATEKTAASFLAIAEGLRRYLDDPDNIELLSEALATRLGSGKATEEFNPLVMRLRGEVVVAPYRRYAELLVDLARHVEDEYQRILAASGQVDMAGLIRKTLDVFNEYPEIASQYTQRFRLVMVDEFQDTSQLQIDMIERIVGTDRHQLCTVGDAQQSIYRFQGADVSVYLQHKRDMKSGGAEVVQLDDNFRSNADILAFVRRVCGQDGYFPEDFLDLKAAGSGKPFYGDGPRVELSLIPYSSHSSSQVKPLQARNAEARHIAERFAQLHETGHSYSDMVLLLGRMSAAQTYARALREAGLPCVVAGGSKFFDAPHVKTCLSLLGALANPYDATCLLTVLTSEVLPVSTNDLLELSTTTDNDGNPKRQHIAKGLVGTDALPENASPLLVHAQAVLYRAWSKLGHIRPAQLLKETVFESGWLGRMQGGGATEQAKAADVLKFIR
ncbi:MAG: ATP-dependent helicase, partial [Eggerthellaceae bacterium]|nr:ATP-dependent helicase [Eggerthellaceae bacterium]